MIINKKRFKKDSHKKNRFSQMTINKKRLLQIKQILIKRKGSHR